MVERFFSDDELRRAAKERIARLLKVSSDTLSLDAVFGEDIKASFVSDWKANELDIIYDDICDIADKKVWKELSSGVDAVRTVRDYCELMVRCYHVKPKRVVQVLFE